MVVLAREDIASFLKLQNRTKSIVKVYKYIFKIWPIKMDMHKKQNVAHSAILKRNSDRALRQRHPIGVVSLATQQMYDPFFIEWSSCLHLKALRCAQTVFKLQNVLPVLLQ